jgi:SAM-dependent methyltransferase
MPDGAAAWAEWSGLSPTAKLTRALVGLRRLVGGTRRRRARGLVVAAVLAPIGAVYAVASVLRDTIVHRGGIGARRSAPCRRAYQRRRFSGTQRFVHWRERALIASFCRRVGAPACILDVPAGCGRFAPLLSRRTPLLVCADIDARRLAALEAALSGVGLVRVDLRAALPFRASTFEVVVHLRYLQHTDPGAQQEHTLAELVRVSGGYVVLSYYRRGNLHGLMHALQEATRANRRRRPTMIEKRELARLAERSGCRIVAERSVLPGFHAQRLVLLEKREPSIFARRMSMRAGPTAPSRQRS